MEDVVHGVFLLLGLVTVGCVLLITVYLILSGLPAITKIGLGKFLFGTEWASTAADPKYGILPFILTSVYGTCGAILLGVPVGFLTAVFLSKMAPKKLRSVMESAVSLLAGIPSVVYGLVGMLVLVPGIRKLLHVPDGASLLSAMIVLAIMILPSIIKVSVNVLGVGRAIGEAMAIIMVAGNVANMPGLFRSVRFLTTGIISGMSYAPVGSLYQQALFSIGLVLFLFIMLINVFLNVFIKKRKED